MPQNSLGQLLMTGVPGMELDAATAATFRKIQPGAFILFGRNIQSPTQLRKLIDDLRDLSEVEPNHHDRPGRRPGVAVEVGRE